MIPRDEYLDNLISFKDKRLIKVVTGVRRCGKSTLFELYQDYLLAHSVESILRQENLPTSPTTGLFMIT